MKVLCIGDVCSEIGLNFFKEILPKIKAEFSVDFCIVNGENSSKKGLGLSRESAKELFAAGADVITAGNHSFAACDEQLYTDFDNVIHPANFPKTPQQNGVCVTNVGGVEVAVLNLIGMMGLPPVDNAFACAEHYVNMLHERDIKHIIVDFHAEATAEKRAMGYMLDGKISALYGTHTHVQTADEQVLPQGTGYITDAGMTGVYHSVLGMDIPLAIERQVMQRPLAMKASKGLCSINAVLFDIDNVSGRCVDVYRLNRIYN